MASDGGGLAAPSVGAQVEAAAGVAGDGAASCAPYACVHICIGDGAASCAPGRHPTGGAVAASAEIGPRSGRDEAEITPRSAPEDAEMASPSLDVVVAAGVADTTRRWAGLSAEAPVLLPPPAEWWAAAAAAAPPAAVPPAAVPPAAVPPPAVPPAAAPAPEVVVVDQATASARRSSQLSDSHSHPASIWRRSSSEIWWMRARVRSSELDGTIGAGLVGRMATGGLAWATALMIIWSRSCLAIVTTR